jgi:predicted enzyme related to lactoylglutathione lyase
MMRFTGICLVTEHVPTLVRYYTEILGCAAQGDDSHAEFVFGDTSIAIFSRQGMEDMAPGCTAGTGAGAVTLGFQVDDVDAQYARIQGLGTVIVKPPATYPRGARSFWFRDPDGNIVDFFSPVAQAA